MRSIKPVIHTTAMRLSHSACNDWNQMNRIVASMEAAWKQELATHNTKTHSTEEVMSYCTARRQLNESLVLLVQMDQVALDRMRLGWKLLLQDMEVGRDTMNRSSCRDNCPKKGCSNRSLEQLGRKIILSAVMFETSVASLLNAESEKLQQIIDTLKENPGIELQFKDLLTENESLAELICCLKDLEENSVEKLKIGKSLQEADHKNKV